MDPRLNSIVAAHQLQGRIDYATSARAVREPRPKPSRRSVLAWITGRAAAETVALAPLPRR